MRANLPKHAPEGNVFQIEQSDRGSDPSVERRALIVRVECQRRRPTEMRDDDFLTPLIHGFDLFISSPLRAVSFGIVLGPGSIERSLWRTAVGENSPALDNYLGLCHLRPHRQPGSRSLAKPMGGAVQGMLAFRPMCLE